MMSIVGEREFLTGFCTHLAGHHHVATVLWVLSIPNRSIAAVACPGLIEVRVRAVGQLMQPGSICMDDVDSRLPFRDIGIVLHPAKEDEHVTGL